MKNISSFILTLLLTATLFNACKKDSPTLDTRLEGRWDLKSFVHEEFIDGVLQQPNPNETHSTDSDYMIFTEKEASFYNTNDELTNITTYTLLGNKLTLKENGRTTIFPIEFNGNDEFSVKFRYDISIYG